MTKLTLLFSCFMVTIITTTSGLPRNTKKTQVFLGNGRWAPIAGSTSTEAKYQYGDHLSTSQSRRVRVISKSPKHLLAQVHPQQHEIRYDPQPYKFGYDFKDDGRYHHYGGSQQYRHEEGAIDGTKRGSYGYIDAQGVYRHVDYVADEHGFRATIRTNEPGTAQQNSAGVDIHVDHSSLTIKHPAVYPSSPSIQLPSKQPQQQRDTKIKARHPNNNHQLPIYRSNRIRINNNKRKVASGGDTLPTVHHHHHQHVPLPPYRDLGIPSSIW